MESAKSNPQREATAASRSLQKGPHYTGSAVDAVDVDGAKFAAGDFVTKTSGYAFQGRVRSVFTTSMGNVRVIVEHAEGWLHIFNEDQLELGSRPVTRLTWEFFGTDGNLPTHLPIGVNAQGQGPEDDADAHHYVCWCGDDECALTLALGQAWAAGQRSRPVPTA